MPWSEAISLDVWLTVLSSWKVPKLDIRVANIGDAVLEFPASLNDGQVESEFWMLANGTKAVRLCAWFNILLHLCCALLTTARSGFTVALLPMSPGLFNLLAGIGSLFAPDVLSRVPCMWCSARYLSNDSDPASAIIKPVSVWKVAEGAYGREEYWISESSRVISLPWAIVVGFPARIEFVIIFLYWLLPRINISQSAVSSQHAYLNTEGCSSSIVGYVQFGTGSLKAGNTTFDPNVWWSLSGFLVFSWHEVLKINFCCPHISSIGRVVNKGGLCKTIPTVAPSTFESFASEKTVVVGRFKYSLYKGSNLMSDFAALSSENCVISCRRSKCWCIWLLNIRSSSGQKKSLKAEYLRKSLISTCVWDLSSLIRLAMCIRKAAS